VKSGQWIRGGKMEEMDSRKWPVFVCVTCGGAFAGMNIVEGDWCPCQSGRLQWAYTPVVDESDMD